MVYVYPANVPTRLRDAKLAFFYFDKFDIIYWLQIIKSVLCLRYSYACVVSKTVLHQTADTGSVELNNKRHNDTTVASTSATPTSMTLICITTFLLRGRHSLFLNLINAHDQTNADMPR